VRRLNEEIGRVLGKQQQEVMAVSNLCAARRLEKFLTFDNNNNNNHDNQDKVQTYRIVDSTVCFVTFPSELAKKVSVIVVVVDDDIVVLILNE
jgi:hypothetical protein